MAARDETARHRRVAELYLARPATMLVTTRTGDGAGGWTTSYTDGDEVVCHLQPASRGEVDVQPIADRLHGRASFTIRLARTVGVLLGDRIRVDGTTYEAVHVSRRPTATVVTTAEVE